MMKMERDLLFAGGVLVVMCWPICDVCGRLMMSLVWLQSCFDGYEHRISTVVNLFLGLVGLVASGGEFLLESLMCWWFLQTVFHGLHYFLKTAVMGEGDLDFTAALVMGVGGCLVWKWCVLSSVLGLLLMKFLDVRQLPWVSLMSVVMAMDRWVLFDGP